MLCQNCHKNLATARYAEVVDGKVTDLHLCPACLKARQEDTGAGFELSGPVKPARTAASLFPTDDEFALVRVCRSCGTRLLSILDSGKVECSQCFQSFAEALLPMLTDLHGATQHVGKSPLVDDRRTAIRANLKTKRSLLRNAVREESYEEAATLRDEIRELEAELTAAQSTQE
jgi:protein arginine kinase activator